MTWAEGDRVEYDGSKGYVFYGVIEGFIGADHGMAMCTDQTGRGSRPVNVKRLRRWTRNWTAREEVA